MANSDIKGIKPYVASARSEKKKSVFSLSLARSAIKLKTVFKSADFVILEKPAGLLVHPDQHHQEKTLVDLILEEYPEVKTIGDPARPGIVHRLDKNVSGLMVVACSQKFYEYVIQQFTEDKVKKEYLALVYGRPDSSVGKIDLPLARTKDGKIVAVQYHGKIKNQKEAITEYEIIKNYSPYSLLKVRPLTGRTNQIRVHLRAINCPIVGDRVYGFKDKQDDL